MTTDEEWRKVPGFPVYMISNYGRMRRRFLDYTSGDIGEMDLQPIQSWQGRGIYSIRSGPKKRRQFLVHRLVMLAFGQPQPSPEHIVAHNDGNPTNNFIGNLRWATAQENSNDRIAHGRSGKGATNPKAKFTDDVIRAIRNVPNERGIRSRLAEQYGVQWSCIDRIRSRRTWAHVADVPS